MKKLIAVVSIAVFSVGCAHTINYPLNSQDRWEGAKSEKVVCVMPFQDLTTPYTTESIRSDTGKELIVNERNAYQNKEITNAIASVIAKHLEYSGVFKQAVTGVCDQADLQLTGEISKYSATGELNHGAYYGTLAASVLGSFVGCGIALAATSGVKAEMGGEVELSNVRLKDLKTGQVLWQGTVSASTNYVAHWLEADTGSTCQRADNLLKVTVAELIHKLVDSGCLSTSMVNRVPSSSSR